MDNVYLPWLQLRTRKWFGFPFPFLPYGRFGLPLPRKPTKGITIVVGQPVDVLDGEELPDGEDFERMVDRAHRDYFDQLEQIFERHKTKAGYPNHTLVFIDNAPRADATRAANAKTVDTTKAD